MYKHFFKRLLDIVLSLIAIIILSPIYIIVTILVKKAHQSYLLKKDLEKMKKSLKCINLEV